VDDKRKAKRLPVHIDLVIKSLYESGDTNLKNVDQAVTVINISKTGLGFISKKEIPLGYFFNARITIDKEKTFYSVLRIVRSQRINDGYIIGCEFVGLADVLTDSIDDYENEILK